MRGKGQRTIPTPLTYSEQEKLSELQLNPLYQGFRDTIKRSKTGLDFNADNFIIAAKKADNLVRTQPTVLDLFGIKFDAQGRDHHIWKGYEPDNLVHRILFYRANPWRFLYDVIGRVNMNDTTQVGTKFLFFTEKQKLYVRDLLDPRVPLLIMSCNRGGSKTWLNAAGACVYQYCVPKVRVAILGGSKQQSQHLYDYFKLFVERSELSRLVDGEVLQSLTRFVHGGYVKALTVSETSVRGLRTDVIFLDEVCEADSRVIKSALPQTLGSANIKIAASSTPHRMVHIFRDWWMDRKYGFKQHHWTAYDCPWITKKSIELLKNIYTEEEFAIECLGQFAAASGAVFTPSAVHSSAELVLLPRTVKEYSWDTDEVLDNEVPIQPVEFFHGIDWGYQHPTVMISGFIANDGYLYIVAAKEMKRWRENDIYEEVLERVKVMPGTVFADSSHIFQNGALRGKLATLDQGLIPVVYRALKSRIVKNCNSWFESKRLRILKEECNTLVMQCLNYSYAEIEESSQEGKIKKIEDDHVDALLNLCWGARGYLNLSSGGAYGKVVDFRNYMNIEGGTEEDDESDKESGEGEYSYLEPLLGKH